MNDFQYYLPVNLIFGRGKTELLGKEAAKYGKPAGPVRKKAVCLTAP